MLETCMLIFLNKKFFGDQVIKLGYILEGINKNNCKIFCSNFAVFVCFVCLFNTKTVFYRKIKFRLSWLNVSTHQLHDQLVAELCKAFMSKKDRFIKHLKLVMY